MSRIKPYSYEHYLKLMEDSSGIKMQEESDTVIERFKTPLQLPTHFAPVSFFLDYTTKKYIYVDESCFDLLGYTARYFLETGLPDYLSRWHPDDFSLLNKTVIPDCLNYFSATTPEENMSIVYSYNYRFRNAKGDYLTVLQRFSYIPSNVKGLPAGMIGVIFDITHFKNDLSIVHTIEKTVGYEKENINELMYKKVHPIIEIPAFTLISKREIVVLKYIADGLSSKQIADKLSLSINTVNNHRKSMLSKTNCKTTAELMNYAVKYGLL